MFSGWYGGWAQRSVVGSPPWPGLKPERRRYEYLCPYCGYINIRYEPCVRIVCDRCKRAFYT